ncbi:hypothetical protein QCA50_004835 [Cerrena zonata]|uniref:Uncharacterized protein n=1 Tax=Cerrena zonata TaxID=2478898 RepID=A0AAW0GFA2_9APHY
MYSPLDIAGLILGILGLSGSIMLVRYLLPKHRIASAERVYATAYLMYQSSVSEGLLLPEDKVKLRENLRRVRGRLNDLKNDAICLSGTWRQAVLALLEIYRSLNAVDRILQSICVRIASTSRQGRERLAKDGIPYEPCMFPLAATISDYLEVFRGGNNDTSNIHRLFSSQDDIPRCSTPETSEYPPPCPEHNERRPSTSSRIPEHRDSVLSTTTTVVEEDDAHDMPLDTAKGLTPCDPSPEKDQASLSSFNPSPRSSFSKEVDPGLALSNLCIDLQSRAELLQSALTLSQTSESPSALGPDHAADLEICRDDLLILVGRLSRISNVWTRRQTGPVLPI